MNSGNGKIEGILKIEWSMMAPFLCTLISNTQRKVLYSEVHLEPSQTYNIYLFSNCQGAHVTMTS